MNGTIQEIYFSALFLLLSIMFLRFGGAGYELVIYLLKANNIHDVFVSHVSLHLLASDRL